MYKAFRDWCERVLRIPADPEPPPGDEHTAQLFRAAPAYYRYLLVVWALKTVAVIAAALPAVIIPLIASHFAVRKHGAPPEFLLFVLAPIFFVFLLLRLLALAIVRLDFEKRWYLVTDRSLRVREGVVSVREMTVTFANIQNISVSQGPVQRLIGIADVRVDTAGGGGASHEGKNAGTNLHTAFFRGVNNAAEIRELIQTRLRRLKDSGLGDHDEKHHAEIARPAAFADPAVLDALRAVAGEAAALRAALESR